MVFRGGVIVMVSVENHLNERDLDPFPVLNMIVSKN